LFGAILATAHMLINAHPFEIRLGQIEIIAEQLLNFLAFHR
jgi:hypothetical protein